MYFLCEKIKKQDAGIRILTCRSLDTLVMVPEQIAGCRVQELAPYACSAHSGFGEETQAETFWWKTNESDSDVGEILSELPDDIPVLEGNRVREVHLPSSLSKVGAYTFYNCEQIRRMELYSTTLDWGAGAFTGCQGIEELVVHVQEDQKSCLKEVLAELRQTLCVEYLGKQTARLYFSEFFEEAVENTPARILSTTMHGCGQNYRNAFVKTQFQFREYDSLFPQLVIVESERLAVRMAIGRLRFPYQLMARYQEAYEHYLSEHGVAAAVQALERKDMEELTWLMEHVTYQGEQLDALIELTSTKGDGEIVSFLMDRKRQSGTVKKRRFQL